MTLSLIHLPLCCETIRAANYIGQGYEDGMYNAQYAANQGQVGNNEMYQNSGGPGTPSRGGRSRPSQPPPAPPSNCSNSTPTLASANNTPTRGRSMSNTGRDTLPPPPPPPGEIMSPPPMNGNIFHGVVAEGHQNSPSCQNSTHITTTRYYKDIQMFNTGAISDSLKFDQIASFGHDSEFFFSLLYIFILWFRFCSLFKLFFTLNLFTFYILFLFQFLLCLSTFFNKILFCVCLFCLNSVFDVLCCIFDYLIFIFYFLFVILKNKKTSPVR